MTPRPAGLTAPFRWLIAAVDVGRQQPQAVIGAVIAAVLASFLPTLPPQLMAALGSPPGPLVTYLFQGLGFAVGVLLVPVIMAGVYRVMDGAERGQPVHAAQVMDGFRDGSWGRLVAVALLSMLVNIGVVLLMIAVALAVVGTESLAALQAWIERVMALQAESGAGRPVPPEQIEALGLPPGLGGLLGVVLAFVPLWLVVTCRWRCATPRRWTRCSADCARRCSTRRRCWCSWWRSRCRWSSSAACWRCCSASSCRC